MQIFERLNLVYYSFSKNSQARVEFQPAKVEGQLFAKIQAYRVNRLVTKQIAQRELGPKCIQKLFFCNV